MLKKEIETMITLIEMKYERVERNTPKKMKNLIKKEFQKDMDESTIMNVCGIQEDFEKENRKIAFSY